MARGSRKPASDSTRQALIDAQRPDMSNAVAPRDTPGAQHLGSVGQDAFDRLYRTRAEWNAADLILVARAARALEIIDRAETELVGQATIVQGDRTSPKPNPLFSLIDQQNATVQRCLRDAHLRLRDGSVPTASTPATPAATGDNVTFFDAWLK